MNESQQESDQNGTLASWLGRGGKEDEIGQHETTWFRGG